MILYLDASALVKRYVAEAGSLQVEQIIAQADIKGTAIVCRAEVSAALAKAARMGTLTRAETKAALQAFRAEWPNLPRIALTETVIAGADKQAWEHGLRGYDAIHLAAAVFWQEMMGEPLTLATFDRQLWEVSESIGLAVWPADLNDFLKESARDAA
jgi:uncharacterized protein